eukprot:46470_1
MKTFVVPIFLTWCSVALGFTSLRPHAFRIAHPSAGNIYPGVGDLIAPPYLAFPTLTTHIRGEKKNHHEAHEKNDGGIEYDDTKLKLDVAELGRTLKGSNVYFVGMMGSGKTTAAKGLANLLHSYSFLDTDAVIEELVKMPLSQYFEEQGEEEFREAESLVLDRVHSFAKVCIATGGGIVLRKENWGLLRTGIVVWINMDVRDIVERLRKNVTEVNKRPLLKGINPEKRLTEILQQREAMYKLADIHVNVSWRDDKNQVIYNIVKSMNEGIKNNPPKREQWRNKFNLRNL